MMFIPMGRPPRPGDPPPAPLSRLLMYAAVFLVAGLAIGAAF
jgi:hypothetical protein